MDSLTRDIISDFITMVAHRAIRKFFGYEPSIRRDEANDENSAYHLNSDIKIFKAIAKDGTTLELSVSLVITFDETDISASIAGHRFDSTINLAIANPACKKRLVDFFENNFKKIKKTSRLQQRRLFEDAFPNMEQFPSWLR